MPINNPFTTPYTNYLNVDFNDQELARIRGDRLARERGQKINTQQEEQRLRALQRQLDLQEKAKNTFAPFGINLGDAWILNSADELVPAIGEGLWNAARGEARKDRGDFLGSDFLGEIIGDTWGILSGAGREVGQEVSRQAVKGLFTVGQSLTAIGNEAFDAFGILSEEQAQSVRNKLRNMEFDPNRLGGFGKALLGEEKFGTWIDDIASVQDYLRENGGSSGGIGGAIQDYFVSPLLVVGFGVADLTGAGAIVSRGVKAGARTASRHGITTPARRYTRQALNLNDSARLNQLKSQQESYIRIASTDNIGDIRTQLHRQYKAELPRKNIEQLSDELKGITNVDEVRVRIDQHLSDYYRNTSAGQLLRDNGYKMNGAKAVATKLAIQTSAIVPDAPIAPVLHKVFAPLTSNFDNADAYIDSLVKQYGTLDNAVDKLSGTTASMDKGVRALFYEYQKIQGARRDIDIQLRQNDALFNKILDNIDKVSLGDIIGIKNTNDLFRYSDELNTSSVADDIVNLSNSASINSLRKSAYTSKITSKLFERLQGLRDAGKITGNQLDIILQSIIKERPHTKRVAESLGIKLSPVERLTEKGSYFYRFFNDVDLSQIDRVSQNRKIPKDRLKELKGITRYLQLISDDLMRPLMDIHEFTDQSFRQAETALNDTYAQTKQAVRSQLDGLKGKTLEDKLRELYKVASENSLEYSYKNKTGPTKFSDLPVGLKVAGTGQAIQGGKGGNFLNRVEKGKVGRGIQDITDDIPVIGATVDGLVAIKEKAVNGLVDTQRLWREKIMDTMLQRGLDNNPYLTQRDVPILNNASLQEKASYLVAERRKGLDGILQTIYKATKNVGAEGNKSKRGVLADMEAYLVSRHLPNALKSNTIEEGVTYTIKDGDGVAYQVTAGNADAVARQIAEKLEAKYDRATLDKIGNEVDALTEQMLDYNYKAGKYTKEHYESLRGKHYVPLNKTFKQEEVLDNTYAQLLGMRSGDDLHKARRGRKGHSGEITSPLSMIWENIDRDIRLGEQNKFIKNNFNEYIDEVGDGNAVYNPDGSLFIRKVDEVITDKSGAPVEYIRFDGDKIKISEGLREHGNLIRYLDKGQQKFIEFGDTDVMRSFTGFNRSQTAIAIAKTLRVMRFLPRLYTTWAISFAPVNAIRDVQDAFVNMVDIAGVGSAIRMTAGAPGAARDILYYQLRDTNNIAGKVLRRGVRASMDAEDLLLNPFRKQSRSVQGRLAEVEEFYSSGGGGTTRASQYRDITDNLAPGFENAIAKELKTTFFGSDRITPLNIKTPVLRNRQFEKAGEILQNYNSVFEDMSRFSSFQQIKRVGGTVDQAAEVSRNVTVNFAKGGTITPATNLAWMFSNANIQGIDRFQRSVRNPKALAAAVAAHIAFAEMQDTINEAVLPDWQERVPEYIRKQNYVFMAGPTSVITIPTGFNNQIIKSAVDNVNDVISGRKDPADAFASLIDDTFGVIDPYGGSHFLSNVISGDNPDATASLALQAIAPQFLDPVVQTLTNRSFFGGELGYSGSANAPDQAIFPSQKEKNDWARGISSLLANSPLNVVGLSTPQIENIFTGYSGGLGRSFNASSNIGGFKNRFFKEDVVLSDTDLRVQKDRDLTDKVLRDLRGIDDTIDENEYLRGLYEDIRTDTSRSLQQRINLIKSIGWQVRQESNFRIGGITQQSPSDFRGQKPTIERDPTTHEFTAPTFMEFYNWARNRGATRDEAEDWARGQEIMNDQAANQYNKRFGF